MIGNRWTPKTEGGGAPLRTPRMGTKELRSSVPKPIAANEFDVLTNTMNTMNPIHSTYPMNTIGLGSYDIPNDDVVWDTPWFPSWGLKGAKPLG